MTILSGFKNLNNEEKVLLSIGQYSPCRFKVNIFKQNFSHFLASMLSLTTGVNGLSFDTHAKMVCFEGKIKLLIVLVQENPENPTYRLHWFNPRVSDQTPHFVANMQIIIMG